MTERQPRQNRTRGLYDRISRAYDLIADSSEHAVRDHRRVQSAVLRNVTLTICDARVLCFRSSVFDAVFMSFALELFEGAIPNVLAEVRRVLRVGGRVGIVAMADSGQTNAMIDLYERLHRRWPHFIDCRPINVVGVLGAARFQMPTAHTTAIWGLPVIAAVGVKASGGSEEGLIR